MVIIQYNNTYTINNKLKVITFSLLFLWVSACKRNPENIDSNFIVHLNNKERSIEIENKKGFNTEDVKVSLLSSSTAILGKTTSTDSSFIFKPIIPFTKGLTYNVYIKDKLVKSIKIKKNSIVSKNTLVSVYPSKDTLPENLLKMYFEFSTPMKEVNNSLQYIIVKNITKDSVVDVFLKLDPELWNNDHSRLTLWLDPGRVKTDLIPNKKLGLPIRKGSTYSVHISDEWKDVNGNSLEQHTKEFYVVGRDEKSPNINKWEVSKPKPSTKDTLEINFKEGLDGVLSKETIFIVDNKESRVVGYIFLSANESVLNFVPESDWEKGEYFIKVDSKLEDLAGNNLNRLFDVDLTDDKNVFKDNYQIEFIVK